MDYKKTLNLPQLSFPKKTDPVKTESEILSLWQSLNVYEKRQKINKGKPKYVIHTYPQQAYSEANVDRSFSIILKDIMIKYKLMSGFDVPYIPVWNCYVPDIEREVSLSMLDGVNGITLKNDEAYQVHFRERCHKLCSKYFNTQKEQFQKLGIFASWDKAVLTSDSKYESEVIKSFGVLYESGYLYKRAKSSFWCINCESDIDVSEIEYKGHDMLSLHVKFPVIHGLEELGENLHILIWTHTPWTLSTLKPIVVHPDYEYAAVEMENGSVIIIADKLVNNVMDKYGKKSKVIKRMKGSDLGEVVCSHPLMDRNLKVLQDKHVSLEKGTGCVYNVAGRAEQNDSDISFSSVNFGEISDRNDDFYNGKVFESSNPVSIELERRGYLLSSDLMEQLYPHCLYCKQPLLTKSNKHWLIDFNANHLKQHTIKALNNVEWLSDGTKKRISEDIVNRENWSISQRRMWGIPIPIFYCKECDLQLDITESIKLCQALIERDGADNLITTKPDDILPYDIVCNNCGTRDFRWEMDTLNADFMSALSYKTILWNQKDVDTDVYLETSNQDTKWTLLSLLSSTAIEGSLPFKSAVIHGHIKHDHSDTDADSIQKFLDRFGAEIIRLCAISTDSSKCMKLTDSHIQLVSKAYARLRNILTFLLGNLSNYDPKNDFVNYEYLHDIDRWALHKLSKLIIEATETLDNGQFHKTYRLIYDFCSLNISKVYISIVRRRLYAFPKWSIGRRAIQTVIYEIVKTITRLIAPMLSFTADEMWSYIPGATSDCPSIYLSKWPDVKEEYLDDELELQWNFLLKVRSAIYRSFEINHLKDDVSNLSQASVTLYINSEGSYNLLDKNVDILPEIFMVSRVRLMPLDAPVPDDIYVLDSVDGLSMEVRRTTGDKCERCLIYSDAVGTSEQYPTLCDRCISVLEGEPYYA